MWWEVLLSVLLATALVVGVIERYLQKRSKRSMGTSRPHVAAASIEVPPLEARSPSPIPPAQDPIYLQQEFALCEANYQTLLHRYSQLQGELIEANKLLKQAGVHFTSSGVWTDTSKPPPEDSKKAGPVS